MDLIRIRSIKTKTGDILLLKNISEMNIGTSLQDFKNTLGGDINFQITSNGKTHDVSIMDNINYYDFLGYLKEDDKDGKVTESESFSKKIMLVWILRSWHYHAHKMTGHKL